MAGQPGCDVCSPPRAAPSPACTGWHVLDGEHAALQDTNDHLLANIQKKGTYSVVPLVAGGEVTPSTPS